ncbi:MAG: zinc-dependent alcohol dehydrogenase family protein [Desulfobacterales bacterium]|nr:zinc-dependent alcohol dehydrogenase family protein [Desulfobacterales bacterium]
MKAIKYEEFRGTPELVRLPDPEPGGDSVVVKVRATGLCLSDWHGWMGHDPDIQLPHVPGHELAGDIVATGKNISKWKVGDRVTVPFVGGCGGCPECHCGNHQVCDHQFQPGFTHWGSFAEYVEIHYADINLVRLPEELGYDVTASLGCRFVTSFRGVVDQGRVSPGQWVAVHGCGGIGLSAIMIATALGANVIAVDIADDKLELAKKMGAIHTINSRTVSDTVQAVRDLSSRGAHVSIDALGHPETCYNSVANLRKRGKHIQIGLMTGDSSSPKVPMSQIVANELEIYGSHGIQAHRYDAIWEMIKTQKVKPEMLLGKTISLKEAIPALMTMDRYENHGITIIDPALN